DLISRAQCEVVIRQPRTGSFSLLELSKQLRDVEPRADVEVGLVEWKIKLEDCASRPGGQVNIMGHRAEIVPKLLESRPRCQILFRRSSDRSSRARLVLPWSVSACSPPLPLPKDGCSAPLVTLAHT